MIATLLLAAAFPQVSPQSPAALVAEAAERLRPATPVTARDPNRIDAEEDAQLTAKDRAIAANGQDCRVIGARRCTSRPRTVISAPIER